MKAKIITKGSLPTHEGQYAKGCPESIGLEYPEEKELWKETFPISKVTPNAND